MPNPFTVANAPYGPTAPAMGLVVLTNPSVDTALTIPVRAFQALGDGVISVTGLDGENATWTATQGDVYACAITHVLAATAIDLLLYK